MLLSGTRQGKPQAISHLLTCFLSSQALRGRLSQNLEHSSFKTEHKSRAKGQVPILIGEANLILKSFCRGIIWCEQQYRGQNERKKN